ncbi:MAG: hypothetical protein JRH11_14510 [Deltaproteobacteria bacterium]|nr:hypothetical protein [Deltaproteobacteria bacterium]
MGRGKKIGIVVAVLALAGAAAVALWPTSKDQVGYPFARRVLGEQPSPMWELSHEDFVAAIGRDAARAERAIAHLERATELAHHHAELLEREDVEELTRSEREVVRLLWWSFLEPLLELDALKHRWEGWYGVDYRRNPELHAMAYGLTYATLCAQVNAGQDLLEQVSGNERIQALFNEAMPGLGLPADTFTTFRNRMTRARDQSFIAVGGEWFDLWIARHLRAGEQAGRVVDLVRSQRREAEGNVDVEGVLATVQNKAELLKSTAFDAWFPVQRDVAEWFGDTRVVAADRRLISDAQLVSFGEVLEPGDIIVERRNWYLSNVGLPGFWPHAALFVGTQDDIRAAFDDDPAVQERYGTLSEYLAEAHPEAWAALGRQDHAGNAHRVLEAVSEGVVAASLEHSCGADYVAALRPRLAKVEVARALVRAFGYFGRPYDFDFDFATDDTVVCSELVMKAYEPEADGRGLRVPPITVVGHVAVPPTEIVRVFAEERGDDDAQLEFVYFLDGRERGHNALVADETALAESVDRPKWDVMQR